MLHNTIFHAIGLMSGSSLDGLDLCYVRFQHSNLRFEYEIIYADCIEYSNEFRERLRNAPNLSAFEFAKLHTELGKYFGQLTADFIEKNKIEKLDFICSHGQTIFHQPNLGFTTQIGCGAQIASQTNCKVVCDLRTSDVANAGQGAPIVPIAEQFLFPDYKAFLNIGGIANISYRSESENESESVIAYDVCAANTLLNYFAKQKGLDYDKDGNLARNGNVIPELLNELNEIAFCKQAAPKSLGTEHIFTDWIPLFEKYGNMIEDKLSTAVEHIAMQVGKSIEVNNHQPSTINHRLFITGGGALNSFLIERIQFHSKIKVVVSDILTVQYKEALAMAFIGLLRILEIPNCLASVTGAKKDVVGGAVYLP
ncbi:MAG TPA: anhydro-N-acetylmuramic acid kinase [Chitinophagales bacterium]|nr:anhydro-N-acetylmuramic acid kinase [Chitinophagales bacterium]